MKRVLAIILLMAGWVSYAFAQNVPAEWVQYTYSQYIYDYQHDYKYNYVGTETAFKDYLKSLAQSKLGEKVRVQVETESRRLASVVNGRSDMHYTSTFRSISNVNLELVEFKTKYDERTQECHAIAYIDKNNAKRFYENKAEQIIGQTQKSYEIIKKYLDQANFGSAKKELEGALPLFEQVPDILFWLNFYGYSQDDMINLQNRLSSREKKLKDQEGQMKHGNKIYVTCTADLFGSPYYDLEDELKGALSLDGCDLVDDPEEAYWVINVRVSTREYNMNVIGNVTTYFAYADARVTIDNKKTSQRTFADKVSVKGGHTFNYTEAGRDAYKKISKQLSEVIAPKVRE